MTHKLCLAALVFIALSGVVAAQADDSGTGGVDLFAGVDGAEMDQAAMEATTGEGPGEQPIENDARTRGEKSWPVPGNTRVSSPVGWRANPFTGKLEYHNGTDIPAPVGTPVVATKDGTVSDVRHTEGAGGIVETTNTDGTESTYMHITPAVDEGDTVESGTTVIGTVAAPGTTDGGNNSTGPHLHYTETINGQAVAVAY
jgi:murein DD-endopeptidase MepM/ murein hydrolase activator NlpD